MTEQRKPARSDAPPQDLRRERDEFLQTFTKGSRLAEEFLAEHERVQERVRALEEENARLRAQVQADNAVRDLVETIARLEAEKAELLSRTARAEAASTQVVTRFSEVESEFAHLANLYVASNQLHASLSPRSVTRRIKEVLAQLVGAERYAMYLATGDGAQLVPIASEGLAGDRVIPLDVATTRAGEVLRSGSAVVDEDGDPSRGTPETPAAILPLTVDERVVGVIVIIATLAQKKRFDTNDFQLFRLLGQHAAGALVSASLFVAAGRRLPGLEAFIDLSV
ncbi:MAG: GAF domain-containing protein [Polyangiaceae bacterium]|nr:GAF domain-containing protein [Polyangiaceae bacterium]